MASILLCQLYRRDGVDFVDKVQGMFAIAISDNNRLVLVRDRFGIKPLYYANLSGRVIFGSEIKAILAHPEFTAKLFLPALQEIFVFGYVYSPEKTLFEGINQVEPSTVMMSSLDSWNKACKYIEVLEQELECLYDTIGFKYVQSLKEEKMILLKALQDANLIIEQAGLHSKDIRELLDKHRWLLDERETFTG